MGIDLLDISHHNTITDWADVPTIPIVHKVCEGGKADRQFAARMPIIESRTELFGGYVVLWPNRPGKISIADQMAAYFELMDPFWRDGCITQLDVEPWDYLTGRDRCNPDEVREAAALHDAHYGPGRFLMYMNPRQMPTEFAQLRDMPLWEPHYGSGGAEVAKRNGAIVHQYTSTAQVSGFQYGIDANRVFDWDALNRIANIGQSRPDVPEVLPPTTPEEPEMIVKTLWSVAADDSQPVYCIEDGCHISGAVRRAWKQDPDVKVIEVYGDATGSDGLREAMEFKSGKADLEQTIVVDMPTTFKVPAYTIKAS